MTPARRRSDAPLSEAEREIVRSSRLFLVALLAFWTLVGLAAYGLAHAGSVPEACRAYQREITIQAHNAFGIVDPPIAVLAAQMQQQVLKQAAMKKKRPEPRPAATEWATQKPLQNPF